MRMHRAVLDPACSWYCGSARMAATVDNSPCRGEPDNRALQAALELSMVNIDNSSYLSDAEDLTFNYPWDDGDVNCKSLNVTQCVSVPSSEHVAEIVGKQGCKIKALRAKTNTYIKTPVRGEEPVFSISGRPDHVNSAKWEIIAAADHFSLIRASRTSSAASANHLGPTDKVTIYVRVPYRVVGLVVGPRGATVKRIQQMTRTFIVTPSRDKEPCFEVRGTPENVERARMEIQSHIVLRTGTKCSVDEEADLYGSVQSIDQLTQRMQQCQMNDANTFQYPDPVAAGTGIRKFAGEGVEIPPSILEESSGHVPWNGNLPPPVFTGMRFTPPDVSYQPMSAPFLSAEGAFDFGAGGGKSQPLSPTGSYESNSSDGLAAVSPSQSPLVPKRGAKFCCVCRAIAVEDMAALVPCGHNLFCQTCAHYIACSTGSCPLCNTQVTNVMHII